MDHNGNILADSMEDLSITDDGDSAFGSATPSDAASILSRINNYKFENGRRYHAYSEGHYYAPNDDQQNQQLDIFNHMFTLTVEGEHYLAPLKDPKRILDLGTGTGLWVMEMAEKFPEANVIGNDLSPIQPSWVPPNVQFEIDDYTRPWVHPRNSFDYIHARTLYGTVSDWPKLYEECYNALAPGGWFEQCETSFWVETDNTSGPYPLKINEWLNLIDMASQMTGKRFTIVRDIGPRLQNAGFININIAIYKIPIGSWPKDPKFKAIGQFALLNMLEGIEGWSFALFTRVLKWSPDQLMSLIHEVKAELMDRRLHCYSRLYVVYGQKPSTGGELQY